MITEALPLQLSISLCVTSSILWFKRVFLPSSCFRNPSHDLLLIQVVELSFFIFLQLLLPTLSATSITLTLTTYQVLINTSSSILVVKHGIRVTCLHHERKTREFADTSFEALESLIFNFSAVIPFFCNLIDTASMSVLWTRAMLKLNG